MSLNLIFVTCFLASLQSIYSSPVSFITKCSVSDPNCMKASAQAAISVFAKGIPELGVGTIDPFVMNNIDASSSAMKLKLKDITATGLSQCLAKKVELSADQSKIFVNLLCTVDARGQYEMDGKVLVLPIVGNGNAHVVLRKVLMKVVADLSEVKGSDGLAHWKVGKWQHTYELKEKATVELDNLFEGNEVLGRAARDLIAMNPNEVVNELGPPIIKAVVSKIVKNVAKFFSMVSKNDLVA